MDVRGQRVLLTGASYGIGAAIARSRGRWGARVVVAARTQAPLDQLAAEIDGHALTL